ncbi:MAG: DUF2845 domain-containing protein [Gammaproteobacteria bacterium]|nr:DUF2845 domain-containing protein [Gammaproteobacteria bacterium]MDE2345896.1 DUF2845 domain-containing protein [Gammaproteobacteria bacterium]
MRIQWIALSIFLFMLAAPAAHAWRCANSLVNTGDSASQVRKKCGPPDYIYAATGTERRGRFVAVDEYWYYNSGPQQLMRELQFHHGKLQAELTLGYGFNPESRRCAPQDIRIGMSAYELASFCGQPKRKHDRYVRISGKGSGGKLMRHSQEWRYDFGSQYLLHEVVITDGRVQEQQALGRSRHHAKH